MFCNIGLWYLAGGHVSHFSSQKFCFYCEGVRSSLADATILTFIQGGLHFKYNYMASVCEWSDSWEQRRTSLWAEWGRCAAVRASPVWCTSAVDFTFFKANLTCMCIYWSRRACERVSDCNVEAGLWQEASVCLCFLPCSISSVTRPLCRLCFSQTAQSIFSLASPFSPPLSLTSSLSSLSSPVVTFLSSPPPVTPASSLPDTYIIQLVCDSPLFLLIISNLPWHPSCQWVERKKYEFSLQDPN